MRKMLVLCGLVALLLCFSVNHVSAKDDKGKDAEGQESSDAWTEVHAKPATDDAKYKKRKKIDVAFKEKNNEGLRIKITKIRYHKKPAPPAPATNPVTETLAGTGPGQSSNADLPADIDWTEKVEIETRLYDENGVEQSPVNRTEYDFKWLDEGGDAVTSVEVGGDAVVAVDEEEPVTLFDIAEEKLGLDSTDFETPDLMVWCHDPINSGELRFCPVGEFRFTSLPDTANIYIFDVNGNDLSATTVAVDYMQLTARGDLSFILNVTGTTSPLGIIVRDVEVTLDENIDENSKHGYTVGGSAIHHLQSEVCLIANGENLLNNWQIMSWTPAYDWGYATAEISGSEDPVIIGATTAVVSDEYNTGFIESIVVEATSVGAIKNGKLILRGVSGVVFDPDDNAKLYLLNAATGEDLYDDDIEATITGNGYGDLIVDLTNIETHCSSVRVKIVLTGIQVSYTAPLSYGMAYDLVSFGPALRAPLRRATPFIEGLPEAGGLPDEPIEVTGWTAIGS